MGQHAPGVAPGSGAAPPPAFRLVPRTRVERLRAPMLTGGLALGLTFALHFRDPHTAGSWGICPFLALTGQLCPGCGSLRAVHDLTNGDLVGAVGSNLVLVAMLPVLVLWWLRWVRRAWTGVPTGPGAQSFGRTHAGVLIAVFTVVMVSFAVLRNLPPGSWLAP